MNDPISELRLTVGKYLQGSGPEGEHLDQCYLVRARSEILKGWYGEKFTRFKESYFTISTYVCGRNGLENPEFIPLRDSFFHVQGIINNCRPAHFDKERAYSHLSGLFTALELMELISSDGMEIRREI
ncbi:hypothetical protein FJZ18_00350 [Candidatus Pacearchaeota archaeon]|nr:hypothetical protein [Candidatus Pacearchaeota archaeon]